MVGLSGVWKANPSRRCRLWFGLRLFAFEGFLGVVNVSFLRFTVSLCVLWVISFSLALLKGNFFI